MVPQTDLRLPLEEAAELAIRVQYLIALRELAFHELRVQQAVCGYVWEDPTSMDLRRSIDEYCGKLDALLPGAPCWLIDPDLEGSYSDCYKSDYGFRPRGSISYQEVLGWFTRRNGIYDRHNQGLCGVYCELCIDRINEESLLIAEILREAEEKQQRELMCLDAPEVLDCPLQTGRGCREAHRYPDWAVNGRKAGAGRFLRSTEKRGQRNRTRSAIKQALKYQQFDIVV